MPNKRADFDRHVPDHDPGCHIPGSSPDRHAPDSTDADSDRTVDPTFQQEQHHLSVTHTTLRQLARSTAQQLEHLAAQAAADKRSMSEELTVNLATADDMLETYAAFAGMNRIIDAYNLGQDINAKKLADIELLLRRPYFAKVSLRFKPGEQPRELYIGDVGMIGEDRRHLVVDWRSPVAEAYYSQEMGDISYEANGRTIHTELLVRRQFDVEEDRLLSYFDTTVAIQDALLLASLKQRRSDQMQAITATIQKEQNRVVRHDDVPVLLVDGVAGSGKTSVMLQRIAYLLYRDRDTLDPRNVTVITPNAVFRRYIDQVLPSMGERNPHMLTWGELATALLPKSLAKAADDTTAEDLQRIDDAMSRFVLQGDDFRDIVCDGVALVRAGSIRKMADRFRNVADGPRRIALIRDEVEKQLEMRLGQMAAEEALHDELAALPPDEQHRLLGELFDPQDAQEARRLARVHLNARFADAFEAVLRDDWLDVERIGRRLLGSKNLRPLEWLYVKMAVTGTSDGETQHVMVDEVQDYTAAQLTVLARYYRRARFLLLGDPNQAIAPHSVTFDQVRDVFERFHGDVEECDLNISYRSAPAIAELFGRLARRDGNRTQLESVQREEEPPHVVECANEDAWFDELQHAVASAWNRIRKEGGLCAIVTPQQRMARELARRLADAGCEAPTVVDAEGELPEKGVVALSLRLAKGLEFDEVIAPDASRRIFGNSDLDRRRLYTTLSRATRRLTVLSCGPLTSWLSYPTSL